YQGLTGRFFPLFASVLALFLSPVHGLSANGNFVKIRDGLIIPFGQAQVELAAATPDALRLSIFYNDQSKPIDSSFLIDAKARKPVEWKLIKQDGFVGIQTTAGRLLMNPGDGKWTLQAADGKTLIPKCKIGDLTSVISTTNPTIQVHLGWNHDGPIEVFGCGNGVTNLEQTEAETGVSNGKAVVPYYWSPAGYAALAITADDNHPASWQGTDDNQYIFWTFPGSRADLYLMPATSLKDAATAYAGLTGVAPVPPRWVFGYLQSRWGWANRSYIEDTLKHFQDMKIPVDAFIYDFEWYATRPDYELPNSGKAGFKDFGWNTNLFPDSVDQVAAYKAQGVNFVGIRKPRLGNRDLLKMVRAKEWDLQSHTAANVPARDLNFADPKLREWYIQQSATLLKDGIDGWWNDEGEATYTTYFYWNLAERIAMNRYRPDARLWTLNRAFSPGTQRFGAAAWTGDIVSSWHTLATTPVNLLNWSLCGMPYGACDIGGFFGSPSPELMSRWMEAGVFFPIMRTHSEVHYQPHFPWLYGPDALTAMRKAIDLRYRLLPYYYSLAHETFETGLPLMRPLVMEFPNDPRVSNMSDEWLMGDSLLAAPVLQLGGRRSVYLPAGDWYVLGTNCVLQGSQSLEITAALDEIPAYVRAGTILPLGPVIQHTSDLPGGPLELQVYPGKDATFTLVEDDGVTQNYTDGKTRRTVFQWNDHDKQLTWKRAGNYSGKDVFQEIHVTVFDPRGNSETSRILASAGSVELKPQMAAKAGMGGINPPAHKL
ncbi:MAG TPA: TIM-barrel domain-containing protein, partial [Verrucomicrobiae bacterium]